MPSTIDRASALADVVLVVHFAFVAFIILGFAAIWIGYFLRWPFVRNLKFRLLHLAAMAIVLVEALLQKVCPLTLWEDRLRSVSAGPVRNENTFMQRWIGRLLFQDWSPQTFTWIYAGFFLLLILSLWIVRPARPGQSQRD